MCSVLHVWSGRFPFPRRIDFGVSLALWFPGAKRKKRPEKLMQNSRIDLEVLFGGNCSWEWKRILNQSRKAGTVRRNND